MKLNRRIANQKEMLQFITGFKYGHEEIITLIDNTIKKRPKIKQSNSEVFTQELFAQLAFNAQILTS